MSELTPTTRRGGAGRPLLWLALLLAALLLSYVTATAARYNPLYSEPSAGISKYRFLQHCKELAEDAERLTVGAMGQSIPLKTLVEQGQPLGANDHVHAHLEAGSLALVNAVQSVQGGGWTMTTPATIGVTRSGTRQTLGELPLNCTHGKDGKTVAQVQLPAQ